MTKPPSKQLVRELLSRGVEKVIVREHLEKRLLKGDVLRIKFGIDPTGSKLHIGHMVVMRKLREFQELGATIIFLIGDFTAKIGDPTGRLTSRPTLSEKEIHANMKEYQQQASKILDIKKTEIRYNSEWFGKMTSQDLLLLSMQVTYQQVSAREDFKNRLARDEDFTVQEFMYPILQGYDSVALKADIEMGGSDQEFNMLMGRRIQRKYGQNPQDVITCPLLLGTDGRKMSKSYDNYIGVMGLPQEMFGKVMSASDEIIGDYFTLCTDVPTEDIEKTKRGMKKGALNPRDAKARLAREIVTIYHDAKTARDAEAEFEKIFKQKEKPSEMRVYKFKEPFPVITDLLVGSGMVASKTEARRLVEQKGVKINDIIMTDPFQKIALKNDVVVQVGKQRFVKIVR